MPEDRTKPKAVNRKVDISQLSSTVEIETDAYSEATKHFREYSLNRLTLNQLLPVDLYVPMMDKKKNQVMMHKIFSKNKPLLNKDKGYLLNMGIKRFFVHDDQFEDYVAYKNENAHRILKRPNLDPVVKAELLYDNANLIIQEAIGKDHLGVNISLGVDYIKDLTEFVTSDPENMRSISEILAVDYTLYTHSVNVCLLLTSFAHFLKLPKEQIVLLGIGALYHDIGKRKIPDEVLNKPGRLDDDEWHEMQRHPAYGYDILRSSTKLDPLVLKMVYQHHENMDGSGYPKGRGGDELSMPSKIIKIIDVYDALTSKRSYKEALSPKEAIFIIARDMAAHVEPGLLKQYTSFLGWMVSGPLAQAKIRRMSNTS